MIQKEQKKQTFVMNKQLFILLLIGGLYFLGIFLSSTFVNVYLWRQSENYFTIALYNLGIYMFQPITFIAAGNLAKRIDRVIVLRIGVILLSLFFLFVLLIDEHASKYHIILGSLLGIGYGFYWLAFNVLTFEITEPDTRDFFNGFLGGLQSLAGMVGPLIAGVIISVMNTNIGYTVIFAVSFVLFICAIIMSFFLNRRKTDGHFQLMKVIKERKRNFNWERVLYAHFFQGLREGLFLFVITIWVFIVTKSEFYLGIFNLVLSGCSFLVYILMTRVLKTHVRRPAILVGSLITYSSVFLILYKQTFLFLIVYAILVGVAYPILNVPYTSMTYDVIGMSRGAKQLRIEYIVVRELYLNAGRVCSIATFLIALLLYPIWQVLPSLLIIFGASQLFMYYYMKNVRLQFL